MSDPCMYCGSNNTDLVPVRGGHRACYDEDACKFRMRENILGQGAKIVCDELSALKARNAKLEKVVEAALKLREHWHGEGYGRYACAGEADFLEALKDLEGGGG